MESRRVPPLDLAIRTEDCGCKVMPTIDEELWIEFCPLHEAAADLLAALELLEVSDIDSPLDGWKKCRVCGARKYRMRPIHHAECPYVAIAKAGGEQSALDSTTGS